MTEKEELENYIKQGFKTHMTILNVSEPDKKCLPRSYWDKKVFALPLWREDGQRLMFHFIEDETEEYARQLVEEGWKVIEYHPNIYVSVLSDKVAHGALDLERVVQSLREVKKWDAKLSEHPNVIEIHFDVKSGDRKIVEGIREDVLGVLSLLTLKNKMGFHIASESLGERYNHNPAYVKYGLEVTLLDGFSAEEIQRHDQNRDNGDFVKALDALTMIYSQVNDMSKITACWATIEGLFGEGKPEHVLSEEELRVVSKAIANTSVESCKKDFIIKKLKDESHFSVKTRNERLAERISERLGEDPEQVLKEIRGIADLRGGLVHTVKKGGIDICRQLQFTEKVLLRYLDKSRVSTPQKDAPSEL